MSKLFPTIYRALANRCSQCGHRLIMRNGNRCAVVNGDGRNEFNDTPCTCKTHK